MVFRYNITSYYSNQINPSLSPREDLKTINHNKNNSVNKNLKELTPNNKLFLHSLGFKVL